VCVSTCCFKKEAVVAVVAAATAAAVRLSRVSACLPACLPVCGITANENVEPSKSKEKKRENGMG